MWERQDPVLLCSFEVDRVQCEQLLYSQAPVSPQQSQYTIPQGIYPIGLTLRLFSSFNAKKCGLFFSPLLFPADVMTWVLAQRHKPATLQLQVLSFFLFPFPLPLHRASDMVA